MPNYEGAPNNLLKEAPKWKHLPSKAIRIPEVYADEVLNFARKLDNNQDTERTLEQSNTLTPAKSPDTECTPEQSNTLTPAKSPDTERTLGLEQKAVKQARVLLTKALKLRANSGGAIKDEIRKALKLLSKNA